MWIITKDKFYEGYTEEEKKEWEWAKSAVGTRSRNYDGRKLPYKFRMKDDDNEVLYHGAADSNDDEKAFAPLDDFGRPNAGCTSIEYYNKETRKWEVL